MQVPPAVLGQAGAGVLEGPDAVRHVEARVDQGLASVVGAHDGVQGGHDAVRATDLRQLVDVEDDVVATLLAHAGDLAAGARRGVALDALAHLAREEGEALVVALSNCRQVVQNVREMVSNGDRALATGSEHSLNASRGAARELVRSARVSPHPQSQLGFSVGLTLLLIHRSVASLARTAENLLETEVVPDTGEAKALDHVLGYLNSNDISERELQMRSGQWLLGKSVDGFLPLGPFLVTADEADDPQDMRVRGWLNGDLRQDSTTADMIFSVAEIIAYASRFMTLEAGDVILTGTPEGVVLGRPQKDWVVPGDTYEVEVEGLGRLTTKFV